MIINRLYSFIQAVYDEVLEYEDGTPATASQVAKDITTFLVWTANHEFDERKQMTIKVTHHFEFYFTLIHLILIIYRLLEYLQFLLLLPITSSDTSGQL